MFCKPKKDCALCPRLVEFRHGNQQKFPTYHNGPVTPFGSLESQILVVKAIIKNVRTTALN